MKYLFALLLTLKLSLGVGQTFEYQCFLKTDCKDTVTLFKSYLLTKGNRNYRPTDNSICFLPDTGTYYLTPIAESHVSFSATAIPVRVDKQGLTTDTLLSLDLYQFLTIHSGEHKVNNYENWQFCGYPADGYFTDYKISLRTTRGFAIWRDRTWAELWIIGQLLDNLPGDINTDYRHIAKP